MDLFLKLKKYWPYLLIGFIVVFFFYPIFKGYIPFPGDLLINQNPYKTVSYLGYAPGGYPDKGQGPDVINEIYPWRYFSINELKNFRIPFWNPYNFSGNPQIANFQTGFFYPINLIYLILPFNLSWTVIIMLQPFLAGLFMYLYLKKGLGLNIIASLIGSLGFGFSSYMVVWIEYGNIGHTILWLPLIFLLTKYFYEKVNYKYLVLLVFSLTMSILAGYIQGVFYIYLLTFSYYLFLVINGKDKIKDFKIHIFFILSLIIPFLLTAFQLLPTVSLFLQSTRGNYDLLQIEKNLAPIIYLITVFIPDFFGNPASRNYWIDGTYIERVIYPGTLILFFAIFGIFQKINLKEKYYFVLISLISLVIATNFPFVKYFYLIPIPVISTTVATREFSIFIFSMIVLGAIGFDKFWKEKKNNLIYPIVYLICLLVSIIFLIVILKINPDNLKITLRNLVIPLFALLAVISVYYFKNFNKKIAGFIFILIVVVDLFYFFNKITPFSPSVFTYPNTPIIDFAKQKFGINRYWGYGSGYIGPNYQTVDFTFSPEGNDPLHISRYGELLSATADGKLPDVLPRPDANIISGYGPDDLKNNLFRKRILDLLGIKYVLHKQELVDAWYQVDKTTFPENDFKLFHSVYPWQIYENLNSLPRILTYADFIVAKNKNEALGLIFDQNVNLHSQLILEETPRLQVNKNASASSKLIKYLPNKVTINTSASGNVLLFLSDAYFPEWKVKIDGEEAKLLLANYAFRAVEVPKGEHRIEFYYDPVAFKAGLSVGFIGLIIFIFNILLFKKYVKK